MNTLTGLIPDIYAALDVVSREMTGFIPACTWDAQSSRAAVGQKVTVPVTPAAQAEDITAGTNPPDTGDQKIDNASIYITKARAVPFRWTGEEQRGVNHGPGYLTLRQGQIAQAIRTLVNEMEADLGGLYWRTSRAVGTAGTTPFGTSDKKIDDAADVLKVLNDNGAPKADLQLVLGSTAATNLRKVANLHKVNEAGETSFLRQGELTPLYGMTVRESAGVKRHVPGTGTGYLINNAAGYGVGATAIDVDTGSGTILAGDVMTIAGDASAAKYVNGVALAGGAINLNAPGLRGSVADGAAITLAAAYEANMAFSRSAIILATRPPAVPEEGDMATDSVLITDPRTGLTLEIRMYLQYRRVRYEVCAAWGVANIKPEHTALLLG